MGKDDDAKVNSKQILKRSNSQTIQSESDPDAEEKSPSPIQKPAKKTPKRSKVESESEGDEKSASPIKKSTQRTPKRQKVVLSSSSSDDDSESDDEDFELDEKHQKGGKGGEDESFDESSTDTGDDSEDDSDVEMGSEEDGSGSGEESDISEVSPVNTPVIKRKRAAAIAALSNRPKPTLDSLPQIEMGSVSQKMDEILSSKKRADSFAKKLDENQSKKDDDDEEVERFDHESFEFIKPEKIKDVEKRGINDSDYDPKTLWVPSGFLEKQTPGHRQWWLIKSQHFDTIILFKVGKFYETYHMDAVEVVRTLNIAFMRGSYAHAGFPEHAASKFADQLMSHGYKVARVEQTETPQQLEERNCGLAGAKKDKVVKREVCRVTCNATRTYGILDGVDLGSSTEALDPTAKYLLAIKEVQNPESGKSLYGVCLIDTTTAKIKIGQFEDDDYRSNLRTLLANLVVVQVLVEKNAISTSTKSILTGILCAVPIEYLLSKKQFLAAEDLVKIISGEDYYGSETATWPEILQSMLDSTSVLPKPSSIFAPVFSAFGAIFWYLRDSFIDVDMLSMRNFEKYEVYAGENQKEVQKPEEFTWKDKHLILDGTAVENLNIVPNFRDSQQSSLFYVINKCSTNFGRRLLRNWLLLPICDPKKLRERQEAVRFLCQPEATNFVATAGSVLKKIPDLERLMQKIHTIGLKYRAEKHPDSRAVFFDTLKTNQRKIQELLATIDGFKMCNRLRKEYLNIQQEGEGCELLDDLLGNEKDMKEVDENIEYFEPSSSSSTKSSTTVSPPPPTRYQNQKPDIFRNANEDSDNSPVFRN
ncbi:unnamed protein product [Caenorhabditis angaria]|uniref:DNA mismatch repair protein MutS core domain-containing protein n=1 Tax=Caenorhabditis angaria TaxID=860376 RepID=A0A9P1I224_9PELO|nr:unnamed protein product [Caenorhabditis angaria]